MVIDQAVARRFIHEYKRFLLSMYAAESADDGLRTIEKLHAARKRFMANRGLLDEYLQGLEDGTEPIDRKILTAIRSIEYSRWVYLRDLKNCSIFLKDGGDYGYGVLGLMDEISVMTGGPGVVVEAGVFAFDDHYVCDGLIANVVELGPNYRRSFNEYYQELRNAGRFRTNPLLPQTPPNERPQSPGPERRRDAAAKQAMNADARKQARITEVAALLDAFPRPILPRSLPDTRGSCGNRSDASGTT